MGIDFGDPSEDDGGGDHTPQRESLASPEMTTDHFRLKYVHLSNFRRFKHLWIHFHPQVTILAGENGSGKTSVLDAVACLLGELLRESMETPTETRPIRVTDAHRERQEVDDSAVMQAMFPVSIVASWIGGPAQVEGEEDSLRVELHGSSEQQSITVESLYQVNRHYLGEYYKTIEAPALLFLYRGTARLWQTEAHQEGVFKSLERRQAGYFDCFTGTSNFALLQSWMRWREQDRLQRFAAALETGKDPAQVRAPHMEAVQDAVVACLEGATRFRYSAATQELVVAFADGVELPLSLLCDGQRGLMALAADIAWRAVQLNPAWGREAPKKVEGVVLIDEIDLHLHPRWQRAAVRNLITAFPRLQFVITTHSPQVLGEAQPEWVRILGDDGEVTTVAYANGKDSNSILSDLMGANSRSPVMQERIHALGRLLVERRIDDAHAALVELEASLGADDSALAVPRWELRMLRRSGQ